MQLFPLLSIPVIAALAFQPYRICAGTATDGNVTPSTLATSKHTGVVAGVMPVAQGDRFDMYVSGIVPVEYGGNVAFGDLLTSDGQGRAIVATVGSRIIGVAQEAGAIGVIGSVLLSPGVGPAA